MHSRPSARIARAVEATLVVVGIVCLARYGWLQVELRRLETESHAAVTRMLAGQDTSAPLKLVSDPIEPAPDPLLVGQIDIPRLRFSAAILAGDDDGALGAAIAYLPDTAFPWEDGNAVLAGHRDRLFRPLAQIRSGDDIWLSTRHGVFQYRVSRTFVVRPADVWVLDSVPGIDLTLITCYPFVYVGHAPQRFVVRAQKVASAPYR